MPRSLAPLRHRGFRLLTGGQLASNFGDAFYAVALPWYVLAEHGGALLLGTVLVAYGVPRTVLLAVGGHASDRWRPWTVMMASDGVRTVAAAALAVAAATGPARIEILVPIAVVLGAGEGLFLPGSFSIVPSLLPDEDLQAGNALSSSGTQLATLVGPAVGGALVAFVGPAPAFAVDAATFLLSALSLAGVRSAQRRVPVEPPVVDVTEAARPTTLRRLLRTEPVLLVILLVSLAANLGSGGLVEVALPALAHGPLHSDAVGYGGLIAAFGAGALIGTIVAAQVRTPRRPAIAGSIAFLGEAVFMAVIPYLGGILPAGGALVVFGVLNGFGNVITITLFQRWAPPDLLGRASGLLMLASIGIFPVSVALGALVTQNFGPAPFFPLAAAALALAVGGGLCQRDWRNLGAPHKENCASVPDQASSTAGGTGDH
ncbi:MAG TPA: MFS transporter [Pseudonocardiaceae bacterium]|nr:MFS transporter [Pseudonocardiaceae bacterium]